jgi:hypothetical protein
MAVADPSQRASEPPVAISRQPASGDGPADPQAWELIEAGRYRPRRIRGSYRGRELG